MTVIQKREFLWKRYRNKTNNDTPNSNSVKSIAKVTWSSPNEAHANGVQKKTVPLKYLGNFCSTLERPS